MKNLVSYGWLAIILATGCQSAEKSRPWLVSAQPQSGAVAEQSLPSRNTTSEPTQISAAKMVQPDSPPSTSTSEQAVDSQPSQFAIPVNYEDQDSPASPPIAAPLAADEDAETPLERLPPPQSNEKLPPSPVVTLDAVTWSVVSSFPGLQAAWRDLEIAQGKEISAWGEFDTKLKAESIAGPMGFYQTYRNALKVEQATMPGGMVYGQYRIGDGNFQPWYGERETNEGGEFKMGYLASLLQNRAIDQRRADIFRAQLQQQQVEPAVQTLLLGFVFTASDAYWSWVAAGASYEVQDQLLKLTEERNRIYELRVQNMDLAEVELLQNRRLIALRQSKLIESERKLQQSAIKLSLFLRDSEGQPIVPPRSQLPPAFPPTQAPRPELLSEGIATALARRPELRELDVITQQVSIDRQLAENQTLPALNAGVEASKDVGFPSSSKGDKTPFELEAGLYMELPYQRRKAQGKIREAEAKLSQLAAKRRLTSDKIAIDIRDAISALTTAFDRIAQATTNVELANELVNVERLRFDNGDSDLLRVALQESAAIEAALTQIEAQADYFKAEAALRASMGVVPE